MKIQKHLCIIVLSVLADQIEFKGLSEILDKNELGRYTYLWVASYDASDFPLKSNSMQKCEVVIDLETGNLIKYRFSGAKNFYSDDYISPSQALNDFEKEAWVKASKGIAVGSMNHPVASSIGKTILSDEYLSKFKFTPVIYPEVKIQVLKNRNGLAVDIESVL